MHTVDMMITEILEYSRTHSITCVLYPPFPISPTNHVVYTYVDIYTHTLPLFFNVLSCCTSTPPP